MIDAVNIFGGIGTQKPLTFWPVPLEQRSARKIFTQQTPHFRHMLLKGGQHTLTFMKL
jgi:hypothetical protein